jgi:tripartite ATP-independent transporter DctP family solute receptor
VTAAQVARPCDPDDVVKCLDQLHRRRRIDLLHARIVRIWGERQTAPNPAHAGEVCDARLWREAMERLDWPLRAKGIVLSRSGGRSILPAPRRNAGVSFQFSPSLGCNSAAGNDGADKGGDLMRMLCMICAVILWATGAVAQTHYSFAYDQPHGTGFGVAGDMFAAKLAALSSNTMIIDQFPGAQLGQEPQALQKIRTGDIDFMISSTANAATLEPEMGVFSLHYLFVSEDHMVKSLADPAVIAAVKELFETKVTGVHVLGLATLGLRDLYGRKEIHRVEDIKGLKVRVQATATEDAIFPAYGAQTVHMPFGDVYTALQTGVVALAENGVNVYGTNKHYETAPIMSMTQHEANCSLVTVSDKVWRSLSAEQKGWVEAAADDVAQNQPRRALALEHSTQTQLTKLGVKFVTDVDKSGFIRIATPFQDSQAKALGTTAEKIIVLIRADQ